MNLAQLIHPEYAQRGCFKRWPRDAQQGQDEAAAQDATATPAVLAPPERPQRKPGAFQLKLLAAMADGEPRTQRDLIVATGAAPAQVYITLQRLIAVGEVVRSGERRHHLYRLVKP